MEGITIHVGSLLDKSCEWDRTIGHVDGTPVICKGQESQDATWMEQWSCVRDKNHKMPCGWNNGHV